MDKKRFAELLDQNMVCDKDARFVGVHCLKPKEHCGDCGQEVRGRVLNYIKKFNWQKGDYWSKRCETCKTTVGRTSEINRDFLGLKQHKDK